MSVYVHICVHILKEDSQTIVKGIYYLIFNKLCEIRIVDDQFRVFLNNSHKKKVIHWRVKYKNNSIKVYTEIELNRYQNPVEKISRNFNE